ncbi:serine hydrolase domain-containing protein [Streptomyces sp. DSM 44917]|uniref:Serine hydrolase domain-containing protein n=1 Tax=Streptomyces boetiae TaxID=3075541 RepID=A0ABU2L4P2_9ACTN|nr:serine hydrolase domain-containing protein [Streptomyces sp. DSM 44917]MDT0306529.1 serine hydrolase domain-containing protein [Streptomyces sp. DSM 44917]
MTITALSLDDRVRRTAERVADGRRGAVAVGAVRGEESALHGAAPDTLFEIGSITKTFTALTLAALAVRGEVAFDAPLAGLLPEAGVPRRGEEPIRLEHLALHTSGLPRLPQGLLPRRAFLIPPPDPYAGCTAEALLASLARTRLRSEPGRRFHYSNLGGGLLGLALARPRSISYEELVRAEVCRPLGLDDTRVTLDADRSARLAPGHSRRGRPRPGWNLAALAGAGGLHSTVPDLLRLARAQFGEAPAPLDEAVALTHATSHRMGGAASHPGWIGLRMPPRRGGQDVLFHNGGTGGYRSLLAVAPAARTAVVVLSANAAHVDRPGLDLLAELSSEGAGA